ncbi:MAG: response regulator [Deltaproteobacteria bacterium]|nr:MAG: response regulator [Deltaproteobacteria bacterium]
MKAQPGGRLVVVDDEPVILNVLRSVLADEPWDVAFAANGAEAKAAMDAGVDVLLTDKNLPDINGLELIRYARECTEDAEAIVLTGYASLDTALEALKLEAFDYIVKPPRDVFEIPKKVRAAFERQHIRRENRRLLRELSERNEALETALSELRRTQSELIQSEKLAGIGTLAAGVAHEISSPLFGVMGLAEAIVDEDNLADIHEYAGEIVSYSRAIKEIVVGLTGYARDAKGDSDTPVDLTAAARDAVRLVVRSGAASEQAISVDAAEAWVQARSGELQQIFVNLVRNAAEAAGPAGHVWVNIAFDGDTVVATVADDGPGLPEDAVSQVFDPFFTTKAPGQGTGLGLNIVYRLVTRYRGAITAGNRPEGGAVFTVRLPATEAP